MHLSADSVPWLFTYWMNMVMDLTSNLEDESIS